MPLPRRYEELYRLGTELAANRGLSAPAIANEISDVATYFEIGGDEQDRVVLLALRSISDAVASFAFGDDWPLP